MESKGLLVIPDDVSTNAAPPIVREYAMRIATFITACVVAAAVPVYASEEAEGPTLAEVIASPGRASDAVRDPYRHPAETLEFFGIEPTMSVVEYGPGGGWYTKVLYPWIAPHGRYMALQGDTGPLAEGQTPWAVRFKARAVADWGMEADKITAFESDEIPEELLGTVDRVLIFRSLHGMMEGTTASRELRVIRALLADDGMVGIVQHRAPENAPYSYTNGSMGYLRQTDVISLFELNGFKLVAASEINANPDDPADWPDGVWTLPPSLDLGEQDRERYMAIGESDRMTLLFRKRD